jgi:hypothetical protein
MHRIEDAIVRGGRIVLSDLPFPDGQRVRIVVTEDEGSPATPPLSIAEVRRRLRGGVLRFDDPCEPMIPSAGWEMLK